ncbi:hypothetical protein LOK49_LG03G00536 [Camellia lanceoleosa]|uniref:Uncharacterized protein n=1 Tax=Camellia lanceoleosa TaxID=1840588 RepID=A0ACC0ID78_9ERIC|nr:hypothetical protein LOK49_LG03G00536 [Camellia lanceoleosa]
MELLVNKRMIGDNKAKVKCIDNMTRWIEDDSRSRCTEGREVEISRSSSWLSTSRQSHVTRDVLEPDSEQGRKKQHRRQSHAPSPLE